MSADKSKVPEVSEQMKAMHGELLKLFETWGKRWPVTVDPKQVIGLLLGSAVGLAAECGVTREQVLAEVSKCFEVVK